MENKNLFKRIVGWILAIAMTVTGIPFDYLLLKDHGVYANEIDVEIEEGLEILNDSYECVTVKYGEEAELSVEIANADGKNISYKWYRFDYNLGYELIEGQINSSYVILGNEEIADEYLCVISDGINEICKYFSVTIDTGLTYKNNSYVTIEYGKKGELKIEAKSEIGKKISYQWYTNDFDLLEGEVNSSYTVIGDEYASDEYYCILSDGIVEIPIRFCVDIDTGLNISYDKYVVLDYKEEKQLEVYAESELGRGISYQWYKGGNLIEGATESVYTIIGDIGVEDYYECKVSDGVNTYSADFEIEINTGLSVVYNSEITAEYGKLCKIKVEVESELGREISYQWYKYDELYDELELIEGATSYELVIPASVSTYHCEISDGIVTRRADFHIGIDTGLKIEYDGNITVNYGEVKELGVKAESELGKEVSYQWYKGGDLIEGATEDTYTIIGDKDISSKYICVVSDGVVEKNAEFEVKLDTSLNVNYDYLIIAEYGKEKELKVEAESLLGKEISYQWYTYSYDGWENQWGELEYEYEKIEGATSSSYVIKADENISKYYYCIVSDGVVEIEALFCVEVDTGLSIEYEKNVTIEYGKEKELKVEAESKLDKRITYQWYKKDGEWSYSEIKGATSSVYVIEGNEDIADEYKCVISDGIVEEVAYFYPIVDTGLQVEYKSNVTVKYGKEVELKVVAESKLGKEISYQWYKETAGSGEFKLIGETNSNFVIKGDKDTSSKYYCKITDGIIEKEARFYIELDTELCVEYEENVIVEYGKEKALKVEAESGLGRKISYQWYAYELKNEGWSYEKIEGEIKSNYVVSGNENTSRHYRCIITDGITEKEANFYVQVDTGLSVEYESDVTVEYGEEKELIVNAVSKLGREIKYQWYRYDNNVELLEGANESSYSIVGDEDAVDGDYKCIVTDGIVEKEVYFFIEVNTGLTVIDNHETNIVEYGKEKELKVEAESPIGKEISYQWYNGDNYEKIEGATSSIYIIMGNENTPKCYYCKVSDGFMEKIIYFYIKVETGINIEYESQVKLNYDEEKELIVNAESCLGKEISYQWYAYKLDNEGWGSYEKIEGAISSSYVIRGNEKSSKYYRCVITDGISEKEAYFNIEVDTGLNIEFEGYLTVEYGKEKELIVNAESSIGKEIRYQWYRSCNETDTSWQIEKIEEAISQSYKIIGDENTSRHYRCIITDGIAEKEANFYVQVDTGLSVQYESDATVEYGKEKELTVNAESSLGKEISYQWYKYNLINEGSYKYWVDEKIEGATGSSYVIVGNEDLAERYKCVVSDGIVEKYAYYYPELDTRLTIEYNSSVTVEYEGEKELKVEANSLAKENISYQWYKYSTTNNQYELIEGAVNSDYKILANETTARRYKCIVSDGFEERTAYFYVYIDTGLNVEYLSNVAVEYGKEKELKVDAVSELGRTLSYQWYRNYEIIEGENDSVCTIIGDENNVNSRYTCEVSDGINTYTAYFYVLVDTGFKVKHENDVIVEYEKEKELKVEAKTAIDNELSYQWYKGYELIEGATAPSYLIVGDKDMYDYYKCIVSDGVNTYTAYFDIQLDSGLKLEYEENVIVEKEKDKELVVHAESAIGNKISYQWYKGYEEIEGATDSSYIIKGTEEAASFYICKVSDGIIDKLIEFDINTDTGLHVEYEKDVKVFYGDKKELKVQAESDTGNEITYQWWDGYSLIKGATDSSYEITGCEDMDSSYCCVVSDGITTEWLYFNVELDTGLNVEHQENVTVQYETNKELNVQAESELGREVSYQWYKYYAFKNTYRLIEGETDSSYIIVGNDYTSNAYKCVISDGIVEKTVYFNVDVKDDIIYGDANGDGKVTTQDAVIMKKYLAGYQNLEINESASDVNCDGKVSSADTVLLLKKLAGYDVMLGN